MRYPKFSPLNFDLLPHKCHTQSVQLENDNFAVYIDGEHH